MSSQYFLATLENQIKNHKNFTENHSVEYIQNLKRLVLSYNLGEYDAEPTLEFMIDKNNKLFIDLEIWLYDTEDGDEYVQWVNDGSGCIVPLDVDKVMEVFNLFITEGRGRKVFPRDDDCDDELNIEDLCKNKKIL